ncbi:hypothetical protein RUM43_010806 [Polyplax serrata]|uniref:Uncharacterized protein n=1 Tax=Polyplax serrata TaxID=468196 RepID=A0AAN8NKY4_POLSC
MMYDLDFVRFRDDDLRNTEWLGPKEGGLEEKYHRGLKFVRRSPRRDLPLGPQPKGKETEGGFCGILRRDCRLLEAVTNINITVYLLDKSFKLVENRNRTLDGRSD